MSVVFDSLSSFGEGLENNYFPDAFYQNENVTNGAESFRDTHSKRRCLEKEVKLAGSSQRRSYTWTQICQIPSSRVGFIIGKGGEQIRRIQADSGCKVQMAHDDADLPERRVFLTGWPAAIEKAKAIIGNMLSQKDDTNNTVLKIPVPRQHVGLVIGRNGEMIKRIQSETGVNIQFQPDDFTSSERIAVIRGPPHQCQHAAAAITKLIANIRPREDGRQGGRPFFSSESPTGSLHGGPSEKRNDYQPRQTPGGDRSAGWNANYSNDYSTRRVDAAAAAPTNQISKDQPDYTKAWEQYFKEMGLDQPNEVAAGGSAGPCGASKPAAEVDQNHDNAWAAYYHRQWGSYHGKAGQSHKQRTLPQLR